MSIHIYTDNTHFLSQPWIKDKLTKQAETECRAFASMRSRLGPVENNANISTISELTEMTGQVAIDEEVKGMAKMRKWRRGNRRTRRWRSRG